MARELKLKDAFRCGIVGTRGEIYYRLCERHGDFLLHEPVQGYAPVGFCTVTAIGSIRAAGTYKTRAAALKAVASLHGMLPDWNLTTADLWEDHAEEMRAAPAAIKPLRTDS